MKLLKILLGLVFSIVAIIVLAIGALVFWVNPNNYKPELEQLAAKQHIALHIEGDLGWSFYPHLGIRSGKFTVQPPMQNITKPLQFDEINVSVKVIPLLHRKIIADTIIVRAASIALHDDVSNSDTVIKNLNIEASGLNLEQKPFPLSIAMQVNTTAPQRQVDFRMNTQLAVDKSIKHIALTDLAMQVDETHFKGNITATLGEKPLLKIFLDADNLDLDHYLATADKKTEAAAPGNKKEADLVPVASIQALPGEYHFSFDKLTVQHMICNQFVTDINISHDGLLTLKKLETKLYGGVYNMHGSVDTRNALPNLAMNMSLKNLMLEPALKDYLGVEKTFASGDFGFDANITTQGLQTKQLMQALDGDFSFASKAITLNKLDLTSSLNQSLLPLLQMKLPALMSGENQTALSDMVGKGRIQHGLVDNTSLTAAAPCTQFSGHGTFDLPSSAIDYHMGITFPSTNTNKACTEINSKLKDISWPVACKGTLGGDASKLCGADNAAIQAIVKKSVAKEVNKKLEKKLDEQIDKKLGKDGEQVKKLLKGLF